MNLWRRREPYYSFGAREGGRGRGGEGKANIQKKEWRTGAVSPLGLIKTSSEQRGREGGRTRRKSLSLSDNGKCHK